MATMAFGLRLVRHFFLSFIMHTTEEPSQATVPMNHLIIGQPTQNTTMAATSPSILARLGNTNRSANSIVQIQ